MTDQDSLRSTRNDERAVHHKQREATGAQYRHFVEKVVKKFPDLSGLGKRSR